MIDIMGSNKTYLIKNKKVLALKDIFIKIQQPGLYIITGKSGSGKSTLLNCLSGIDRWDDGNVNNIADQRSFIFQDYRLFSHLSAYENAKFAIDIENKSDYNKVDEIFNTLQIDGIKDHEPNQLSGGQQQRVAIARAILMGKPYIFADEPTGNLDEENAKEIAKILKKISQNKIVIVATHDVSLFTPFADEVYTLENGELITRELINKRNTKIELDSEQKEAKLNLKHIFRFATKGYKTNYLRLIILMFTLVISFLTSLIAINILVNSVYKIKEKQFNEHEIHNIEIVKYKNELSNGTFYSLSRDDSIVAENTFNLELLSTFTDGISAEFIYDNEPTNVIVNRIYQTSKLNDDSIYGVQTIDFKEIVISQQLANELINHFNMQNIDELKGITIYLNDIDLTIIDILNKGIHTENINNTSIENDQITLKNHSIYMSDQTYYLVSQATLRDYINASLNGNERNIRISNYEHRIYQTLIAGTFDISDHEVIIDYDTAIELSSGNVSELIGTEISLGINQYTFNINEPIANDVRKYVIKGIFTEENEQVPWMFSDEEYNLLSFQFGRNNYQSNALNGIVISSNQSNNLLKQMDNQCLTDYTYISQSINITKAYIDSIAVLILIVAFIVLSISILVTIGYLNNSIDSMRSEIGILRSLNIKMKDIVSIFTLEISIIFIVTIVFVTSIHIVMINIFNQMLITMELISFNFLYYEYLSILISFAIPLFLSLIFLILISNKFSHMSSIDLIKYE